jgi:DNA-binding transcriptional ArsR family regulator
MRILLFLKQRDASVQEVADELMLPQQSASHHLNVLYRAGVLSRTPYGTSARFALADYAALRMIEHGRASLTGYAEELTQITCPQ